MSRDQGTGSRIQNLVFVFEKDKENACFSETQGEVRQRDKGTEIVCGGEGVSSSVGKRFAIAMVARQQHRSR